MNEFGWLLIELNTYVAGIQVAELLDDQQGPVQHGKLALAGYKRPSKPPAIGYTGGTNLYPTIGYIGPLDVTDGHYRFSLLFQRVSQGGDPVTSAKCRRPMSPSVTFQPQIKGGVGRVTAAKKGKDP